MLGKNDEEVNNINNITLLDAATNNEIGSKSPGVYLGEYSDSLGEDELKRRLKTHLINLDGLLGYKETKEGIEAAYNKFLDSCSKNLSKKMKKLVPNLLEEEEKKKD